jgi:hypothetical protein
VVSAQICTERTLHLQGNELQEEVVDRRGDVALLLGKVAKLSEDEVSRVQKATVLVSKIQENKEKFLRDILNMTDESNKQSKSLCKGVGEILRRGRETCSSLKESIDGALSTLIGKLLYYVYLYSFLR